jgi:ABC-type molybdate transport system substrate-binding protein
VGPLPEEIQFYTVYAADVMAASRQQDAGKALIAFLGMPAAWAVMKSKGFTQF